VPAARHIRMGERPLVSVVIAARNAEATLGACLASVARLDYPRVELLVADDGSSDDTAGVARRAGARVVEAAGVGPAAARNLAVAASSGQVIAFTDADCEVPPDWLSVLVDAIDRPGVASAGGGQVQVFGSGGDPRADAAIEAFFRLASFFFEYPRDGGPPRAVAHIASCNSAYRRDAFLEVGGFTPGLFPGEDVDLDYRLRQRGYRAWFVPSVRVRHHRPGGWTWFTRMMRRYGRGQGVLARLHGPFRLADAVPPALLAAAALQVGLAAPVTRPLVLGADALAAALACGVLAAAVPVSRWSGAVRAGVVALAQWTTGYVEGVLAGPPACAVREARVPVPREVERP
jgi:GT2 family glycosyltransferase